MPIKRLTGCQTYCTNVFYGYHWNGAVRKKMSNCLTYLKACLLIDWLIG